MPPLPSSSGSSPAAGSIRSLVGPAARHRMPRHRVRSHREPFDGELFDGELFDGELFDGEPFAGEGGGPVGDDRRAHDRGPRRAIRRLTPILLSLAVVAVGLSVATSGPAVATATGPLLPFSEVALPAGHRALPRVRWASVLDTCPNARVLGADQLANRLVVAVACGVSGPATLHAFDAPSGDELWHLSGVFGPSNDIAFTIAKGLVIVGTDAQFVGFGLVALDLAAGRCGPSASAHGRLRDRCRSGHRCCWPHRYPCGQRRLPSASTRCRLDRTRA